jgi:polysaccharide pyruvyl transferase CsaB
MKNNHRLCIGISGSYGGLNLGDEAILHSIVAQIRSSIPAEITVFTRNAEDTIARHDVDRAVAVRKLARPEVIPEIEHLDLLIVGGGGILYDADVKQYLREAVLATEKKIPVMLYAVGVGPLNEPLIQEFVKNYLATVDVITVRDRRSRQILEEIGLQRDVLVTADPALLLTPESIPVSNLKSEGLTEKKRTIGMSVREAGVAAPDINEEHYHILLANAADYMIERFDADIIFIPMEPKEFDLQHSHAVMARMLRPQRASIIKGTYTSGQLLTIIGKCEFTVGMRLHFLIFSAIMGIPFVALPYSPKVAGFLEDIRIEMPPINLVNEGRLMAYIDRSWDQRKLLQDKIKQVLPILRRRAQKNNELLLELINTKKEVI